MRYQSGLSAPKPRHKKLFEKSFLELQKLRQNKVVWLMRKFLRIFKGLFVKSPLKQGLERQFQHTMKNKKHGDAVFFCEHCQSGLSAPNPDTRNFSGKVSWNFKSFAKVKWCGSVGNSFAYFSYKKSRESLSNASFTRRVGSARFILIVFGFLKGLPS